MVPNFSDDISEFLSCLSKHRVRYVIVGGEAVIYYGHARLTGDIDIFYEVSAENAWCLYRALSEFWSGDVPGIANETELLQKGMIFQFGVPPNRIDLLTEIEGVDFREAWKGKTEEKFAYLGEEVPLHFMGLDELIDNKRSAGRHRDLEDLEFLLKVPRGKKG